MRLRDTRDALPVAIGAAALLIALFGGCECRMRVASAATLTIRGTAPAFDNPGTCTTPTLIAASPGAVVTVHVSVSGPVAYLDSVAVAAGSLFALSRQVPAGTYSVRAWASDSGGAGCDTTITVRVKNPPWKVRL